MEQFEESLSRLGSDLARWPAAARTAAEALVATDSGAATLHRQAQRLDALLGEAVKPVPFDSAAMGRVMAGITSNRHHDLTLQPTRRLFAWASAAMVVFLVAGYAAGIAIPSSQGEDTLAGLMFGTSTSTSTSASAENVL